MEKFEKGIENILEMEGVNAEGYGLTSQAIMFDKDVSIVGKSIYAYLCSYLGAGRTTFPKVTTILSDLKIAENTFYKHFKPLLEKGYIRKSKAKGFLNRNVYTICNNVAKLKVPVFSSKDEESQLALDGINASGYGFIPKLIMKDKRLTAKAKGLIAFLYSIAQADSCAYPHRTTICTFLGIGKSVYYNALNQLIELNYITVIQRHSYNGRFSVNDYILNSNPKIEEVEQIEDEPCLDFCGYEENGLNSEDLPCPDFCGYEGNGSNSEVSPCPNFCGYEDTDRVLKIEGLPCSENCGDNNITSNNNTIISNKVSSNHKVEKLQYSEESEVIRQEIYKLSWYDYYANFKQSSSDRNFRRTYCTAVNALVDMLCQNDARYAKEYVTRERLFNMLNECIEKDSDITYDDSDYIPAYNYSIRDLMFDIVSNFELAFKKYEIRSPRKYLKSLIWDNINNYF